MINLTASPKQPFEWDNYSLSIIANINMWLNAYDRDLNLVVWNPVAEKISGYSREEVIGTNEIWDWLYPDETYRREIMERASEESLFNGSYALAEFETEITCKNGALKTISWSSRSLFDADDQFQGVITLGYDTTDRKKAEEQSKRLAVLEERRRLARDLHDAVTQSLYSLTLFAEAGQRSLRTGKLEDAENYLTNLSETAQHAVSEMRLLLHELRPLDLESEGIQDAVQRRLDAVERRVGTKVRLMVDPTFELPPHVEQELYRVIQEALNNTLRHASATSLLMKMQRMSGEVTVQIVDDGVGFSLDDAAKSGGMGLRNMRERIEQLGGILQLETAPDAGVRITVKLNVDRWDTEATGNG